MNITERKPFTPGEILLEEFMQPYGLTQDELAKRIHVTRRRINEIINGKRAITPDSALRLGKLFNMSPDYWLNLQIKIDLWKELHDKKVLHALENIKAISKAA
jgi:addiction module HigA family antidote